MSDSQIAAPRAESRISVRKLSPAIGAEVLVYHAGVLPNLYSDGDALTVGTDRGAVTPCATGP